MIERVGKGEKGSDGQFSLIGKEEPDTERTLILPLKWESKYPAMRAPLH